ncbi:MAG: S46 family peptidase [Phycisphaerales bacterium]|nr:MAG: S46 family peptidase [Phycisphaerales bacterium]
MPAARPRRSVLSRSIAPWLASVGLAMGVSAAAPVASGDEGMWLVNQPPKEMLRERYAFEATDAWMTHQQRSACRLSSGGSGSLVSANGLVLTNHHVARGLIAQLTTEDRNLLRDGFLARAHDEELRCQGASIDVLMEIEDVTELVNAAVPEGATPGEANAARRRMIAEIEEAYKARTGMESQVVTLYQGARYHLYGYKRYTDVRLVWAPEGVMGHFGGDVDNFEYPRYSLDAAFLRVYEDDKPAQVEHHLTWSEDGLEEGDLVFVFGHPGSTRRLNTFEHLRFIRDVELPQRLNENWRMESKLREFVSRGEDNRRVGSSSLMGVQNGRKFRTGMLEGLLDPELMSRKREQEAALRAFVREDADRRAAWGDAWQQVADARQVYREFYHRQRALSIWSDLYAHALHVVRLSEELPKESGARLSEYRDTNLESVYRRLYAETPIHENLEIERLTAALSYLAESMGGDDPLVRRALGGKPPRARARELVENTRLFDAEIRRDLVEGGADAVASSDDPIIELARALDAEDRWLREWYENEVEGPEREAYAKIAEAQFEMLGENQYPDATFTLRMTFGTVEGVTVGGEPFPAITDYAGMYARAEAREGEADFTLPQRWLDKREALDESAALNFVSTVDLIGGNSGSPVVNREGELVGLIFDGNLDFLATDFIYPGGEGRGVAVDARGILEALRSVYEAEELVAELVGGE